MVANCRVKIVISLLFTRWVRRAKRDTLPFLSFLI
ncbi:Uncharacterised protein [Vibrio cholerae]|nr:Uncharacterised protein [Vibrio cholerae]